MASQIRQPATNARIIGLLEEVKAELARTRKQQEQIAHDLAGLLGPRRARGSPPTLGVVGRTSRRAVSGPRAHPSAAGRRQCLK